VKSSNREGSKVIDKLPENALSRGIALAFEPPLSLCDNASANVAFLDARPDARRAQIGGPDDIAHSFQFST
jgi:hypothetical protein